MVLHPRIRRRTFSLISFLGMGSHDISSFRIFSTISVPMQPSGRTNTAEERASLYLRQGNRSPRFVAISCSSLLGLNFPLHILQALCKLIFEMSNARSARLQLLFSFQLKNSNATIGFDARHGSLQIWKSCQYGLQPLQRLCARLDHGLSLAIFSLVCKTRLPASYLSLSNTKNTSYFFSIKFVPPLIGSASLCFYFRAAIRMPPYLVAMTILHTILWLQNVG